MRVIRKDGSFFVPQRGGDAGFSARCAEGGSSARGAARIRGIFSHVREYPPLFRTGAKHFAALMPRGGSAGGAARDAPPIFFPRKENGRCPSKRKAFILRDWHLKSCGACRIRCGVRGFATSLCESLRLATAPYYREARVTLKWRQTACGGGIAALAV